MEFLRRLQQQLRDIWLGMTVSRRVMLVAVTVTSVVAIVGVGYWAATPDYATLYSGLALEDAGAVTTRLQALGVTYRLSGDGTTIQVPADSVRQLRVNLAAEGLPVKGTKGFEIFDEAPLGMTPFVQHVNFGRALQAELARTIMQIEPVAFARVHIVRPDPSPFIRERKPTTASVVLKLRPGATLSRGVANGIVALVARSVEGLTPDQVAVLDTSGRVLSDQRGPEAGAVPGTQLEYRRELETHLASKAEDMLAQLLGPGRAVVRVTADVDFKRVREKRETYSPEDKVITSEKVTTSKTTTASPAPRSTAGGIKPVPGAAATDAGGKTQDETVQTDYAVSKTVRELEDRVGTVERLTIAALVDLAPRDEAASGPQLTVAEAQDIIKQAVGFKKDRDEIKVSEVKLAVAAALAGVEAEAAQVERWQYYLSLVRNASLGVAALIALLLGFLFLRRWRPAAAQALATAATEPRRNETLERLASAARHDPAAMARALAQWLRVPEPASKPAPDAGVQGPRTVEPAGRLAA